MDFHDLVSDTPQRPVRTVTETPIRSRRCDTGQAKGVGEGVFDEPPMLVPITMMIAMGGRVNCPDPMGTILVSDVRGWRGKSGFRERV